MNKSSKALFSLLMLLSAKAFTKESMISADALKEGNLDNSAIAELLNEKYLLPANVPNYFFLNDKKVDQVLSSSQDSELKEFLEWLKSIVGDGTDVNQKKPGDMTPASQDIMK